MQALLFVDLLGARKYWQRGGVAEDSAIFAKFARKVVWAAKAEANGTILDGGIENDRSGRVCLDS